MSKLERKPEAALFFQDDDLKAQIFNLLKFQNLHIVDYGSPLELMDSGTSVEIAIVDDLIFSDAASDLYEMFAHQKRIDKIMYLGSMPDTSMFTWLHGVLHVSKILITPIEKETFQLEIEQLIANPKCSASSGFDTASGIVETARKTFSEVTPNILVRDDKLELRAALEQTKHRLRQAVSNDWDDLSQSVNSLFEPDSAVAIDMVVRKAHTLRGNSGSLDLQIVSQCAAKIEEFLKQFYDPKGHRNKILRSEILQLIDAGAKAINVVCPNSNSSVNRPDRTQKANPIVVLLVGDSLERCLALEKSFPEQSERIESLFEPIKIIEEIEFVYPDLIVLDLAMTSLSPYDLARHIRSDQRWTTIPVIALDSRPGSIFNTVSFPPGVYYHPAGTEFKSDGMSQLIDKHASLYNVFYSPSLHLLPFEAFINRCLEPLSQSINKRENFFVGVIRVFSESLPEESLLKIAEEFCSIIPAEAIRGVLNSSSFFYAMPGVSDSDFQNLQKLVQSKIEFWVAEYSQERYKGRCEFTEVRYPRDFKSVADLRVLLHEKYSEIK